MRRVNLAVLIMLQISLLFFIPRGNTQSSGLSPLVSHDVRVLVVSPADIYYSGANSLLADLARYGFNVTYDASSDGNGTDYLTDPKTSDLSQYDVVILHGILGYGPSKVSAEEVAHFTDYKGILVLIGNALFSNKTDPAAPLWGFDTDPVHRIEQRLGVDFIDFLGSGGAWHNTGTFTLMDSSIRGLPTSLQYVTRHPNSIDYQFNLKASTNVTREVYDFTITSSSSPSLIGKSTAGVTFYRNATGAVGIYVQGAYVYGEALRSNSIGYWGLTDIAKRCSFLSSMVAYALGKDIGTIIKPQPLANIRLDGVGEYYYADTKTYLNASLSNFDSVARLYNINPTIGFIDFLSFRPDYWKIDAKEILPQLMNQYRDWEYATNLRYYTDPGGMTVDNVNALMDSIVGNYSKLGMDLFSTVIAPQGRWNQSIVDVMANRNLYVLGISDGTYPDWWNLRINSGVLVQSGASMLPEQVWNSSTMRLDLAENFTQTGLDKDSIYYNYFSRQDKLALAVLNGFPSFVFYLSNFRWNQTGTYGLRTVYGNLTSEIPDIRFVPLQEAGLYFGNSLMRVTNANRNGSVVEFDVDASSIPSIVSIGKGMLWLNIGTNEPIQEVTIDNNRWFYFDEHSIRIPTPKTAAHIRITLGTPQSPRIDGSKYKVVTADYDGYSFNVSMVANPDLNSSASLFLPVIGPFIKGNWSIYTLETQYNYKFDNQTRTLKFWAISGGFINFRVGVFWIIDQGPASYDSEVPVRVDFSPLGVNVTNVILSYSVAGKWTNVTTVPQGQWFVASIPAFPYGTSVKYKLYAYSTIGRIFVTETIVYDVLDYTPPEAIAPQWNPQNPNAGEPVNVKVSVSEPENASGVKSVVLRYYTNTSAVAIATAPSIVMKNENGTWVADIPGQSGGTVVTFFVIASDNAGNQLVTASVRYSVFLLPISPLYFILIVGTVAAACIVTGGLYLRRRRSIKQKVQPTEEMKKETKTTRLSNDAQSFWPTSLNRRHLLCRPG